MDTSFYVDGWDTGVLNDPMAEPIPSADPTAELMPCPVGGADMPMAEFTVEPIAEPKVELKARLCAVVRL